jgi:hypothetical protein
MTEMGTDLRLHIVFQCWQVHYLLNIAGYLMYLFRIGIKRGDVTGWKSGVEH